MQSLWHDMQGKAAGPGDPSKPAGSGNKDTLVSDDGATAAIRESRRKRRPPVGIHPTQWSSEAPMHESCARERSDPALDISTLPNKRPQFLRC